MVPPSLVAPVASLPTLLSPDDTGPRPSCWRPPPRARARRRRVAYYRAMPASRLIPLVVAAPVVLAVAGFVQPDELTVATAERWRTTHVVLLPVLPLLAGGSLLLLRGIAGAVPAVARVGAYGFAVCYTAFAAITGVAAATVVRSTTVDGQPIETLDTIQPQLHALFDIGNLLGVIGAASLLVAAAATAVALVTVHGAAALPGAVLFVLSTAALLGSHINAPVGGIALLVMALGLVLLARTAGVPVKSSTDVSRPRTA